MLQVYEHLALPEAAYLGKRVYKKLFFENAELSAADRRAFTDDVETVTWQYTLKPSTLPVSVYQDDERDYSELAVIEVELRDAKRAQRLAEIIHRAIPYPLLLILMQSNGLVVSTAHKRASRAERGAVVAEEIQTTAWMDHEAPEAIEQAFLQSLTLRQQPQSHYYALYDGWHQRLLALACARLNGTFRVPSRPEQQKQRRETLTECHRLEGEISRLRAEIKKETRFNRQVEVNTRIKQLEQQLQLATAGL
ncbi:DUF4391 domain-containing protein [Spiribacter vilamensis]|uniref:Uncharacterized protein DUF4391 n=1 Tax=Spiribacter vilamensis TaxID=531306 RepID=A0A4Q8D0B4_9GAMM|nr:DUF4391 domain-containing protein [Spiribacter vilamensis]RZU98723.1 uncharacterized protein DUF4391 [Spiribacter vilamensis]TVO62253.1 DUF4391 domain-containing protein [Spiribacter vilamensis]